MEKQRNGLDRRAFDKQRNRETTSWVAKRKNVEKQGSGSDVRWTGGDERCIAAETLDKDGIRAKTN